MFLQEVFHCILCVYSYTCTVYVYVTSCSFGADVLEDGESQSIQLVQWLGLWRQLVCVCVREREREREARGMIERKKKGRRARGGRREGGGRGE